MMEMKAIKVLVIEDMVDTIRGAFELAALSEFNENMCFVFKTRSQDVDYGAIGEYALVFVDIELAKGSKEDGFAVLQKLLSNGTYPLDRTFILTGNTVIEERLLENSIDPKITVVKKPVNYEDIAKALKKKIRLSNDGNYSLIGYSAGK